jgi:hypothetical protein
VLTDLRSALEALNAHEPEKLLGLRESQWIDAKGAAYHLAEDPHAPGELAKDVAAFANGGGGVIVLGIITRPDNGGEVLDRLAGADTAKVDRDRMNKLISARITPFPRGVRIASSGRGDKQVVFISVPKQAPGSLFVVAAPDGKAGAPRPDTVAVPIRDGDRTIWLPRTEIHALLTAGVRASGQPTAQALADLVRTAVSDAVPTSAVRIGQGLPDREREIRDAHRELAAAGLGAPAGEARAHGAAALQDLDHEHDGQPGWVLCLVPGQPPVAVAAPVWQALLDAGRHAPGLDPLAATGYPLSPQGPGAPGVIEADARRVDLDGGAWGAGRLTCADTGGWQWSPLPRFNLNQGRSAEIGVAGQTPALRLRAVVTLPWAHASTLQITKPQRSRLERELPYSALAGAASMLSTRRGALLSAARWERGPLSNSTTFASYTCTISAPDGSPALKAAVLLALPSTMDSTVTSCAEVMIEDPSAWTRALDSKADTQLSFAEVQAVLLAAWETAADLLPGILGEPSGPAWAAPPTTELRMTSERPGDHGVLPALDTLIDLAPLGDNADGGRQAMAVAITVTPTLAREWRQGLMRQALVHMAQSYGYIDAEVEHL